MSESDSDYFPSSDSDFRTTMIQPSKKQKFVATLTRSEKQFFACLPEDEKTKLIEQNDIVVSKPNNTTPLRFKILGSDMEPSTKGMLLSRLDNFQNMREGSGEYFKLRTWFTNVCRIPFGNYITFPVNKNDPKSDIAAYLTSVKKTLDSKVYGHTEAKDRIVQILAQWISNPQSKGNCIGIHGSMGVGKTMLVKEGICKALDLPFGFIALGGASDASFLEGHGFTYEGSTYGKIAEILMKTQVMNPVLFFDELDKVSSSHRGEEIIGVLTHLTDSSQNERFCDRYFGEIELDLSKALIVFSYNDESLVNPILKDRMITIEVAGYSQKEKVIIARKHLIPAIIQQFGFRNEDVTMTNEVIEFIIQTVPEEDGVRNLKRGIETIISCVNLQKYSADDFSLPFSVSLEYAKKSLKNTTFANVNVATKRHFHSMYT